MWDRGKGAKTIRALHAKGAINALSRDQESPAAESRGADEELDSPKSDTSMRSIDYIQDT